MPYYSYIFFDVEATIHAVGNVQLENDKRSFIACVDQHSATVPTQAYATLAFKPGTRFMIMMRAETPEAIQLFVRDLLHTTLGAHLRVAYTLFGMTRPSHYKPPVAADDASGDAHGTDAHAHSAHHEDPKEASSDMPHRYLVVYPFTKTTQWHLTPFEERRATMKAHVSVGRKYSETVSQLLLYAYGIDDHEFIVSYYTDSLADFQSLVMDMRNTESRRETKNDLPIFTCIHMPLAEALTMI